MMPLRRSPTVWSLAALCEGWASIAPAKDRSIGALTLDSREVGPGSLFLACPGTRGHGLDHALQAQARGAAAILYEPGGRWGASEIASLAKQLRVPLVRFPGLRADASALAGRFYGEPSRSLQVLGITGTNGKTSVSHYLAQALEAEVRCGIVGTLGNGFPGDLAVGTHTTPDPVRLQGLLAELLEQGAGAIAMEVSSHALDQGRAAAVRFHTAIFTNLTRDHLDYHGDMARYAGAKQRLFVTPGLHCAVLNWDDPMSREILAALAPQVNLAVYGTMPAPLPEEADYWIRVEQIQTLKRGMRLRLSSSAGDGELTTALLGRFNASNLMAVGATLLSRGLDLQRALEELARIQGVPGRMECFGAAGQPLVVVDYAHTPDALEQALSSLRPHVAGRLITLFGCGGDRDQGKRPLMGAVAERLSDQVILSDDNPRWEDAEAIIGDILGGIQVPDKVKVERNRALAIRWAICSADRDDAVLVAGKGHETTQQIGDLKVHFSDRAQVVQVLREREGRA